MRIIGLDASTTTVGYCVLDILDNGKYRLLKADYFKPPKHTLDNKEKDFINTLIETKKFILELMKNHTPDAVAIEDYVRFMKGASGAATTIPLAIFNRSICMTVAENYPELPLYICNVMSIRSLIRKKSDLAEYPKKEDLPPLIEKLANINLPIVYKETKKGPKKLPETLDICDAVCVAYYAIDKYQEALHSFANPISSKLKD